MIDTLANRVLLAGGMAACVVVAARWRGRGGVGAEKGLPVLAFAAALVGAVVLVVLATRDVTMWGFHGQMHWAYSLATLRGGGDGSGGVFAPPEDPVFAGEPLLYPWPAHWVYGHVARALRVSPISVIAGTDVLWLAMMVLATGWAAKRLTGDRTAGVVAAFLAWAGLLVTDDAYIAWMHRLSEVGNFEHMKPVSAIIRPCMRIVPADKFFQPNNNPIGLGLSALAVWCLVRLNVTRGRQDSGRMWMPLVVLSAASFVCALMYPISSVGMVGMLGGGAAGLAIVRRRLIDRRMLLSGIAVGIGGLCALPWLLQFGSGKQPFAQIVLTPWGEMAGKVGMVGVVGGLAVVLLVMACRGVGVGGGGREEGKAPLAYARGSLDAWAMLLGAVVVLVGMYVVMRIPRECEYKFLAQTAAPLACLVGPWVAGMLRRRWWVGVLVLWPLALGAADRELIRFDLNWKMPIVVRDGRAHAKDAGLDEMLIFLRDQTQRNAVILTEEPLVPTVAERSLYLLPDSLGKVAGDGWSMGRYRLILEVIGHATETMKEREVLQHRLLGGDAAGVGATLRKEFGTRPVYAMVTGDSQAIKQSGEWNLVRKFGAGEIWELGKE